MMAIRCFTYFLVLFICTLTPCNACPGKKCFQPTAAVNRYEDVFLFDGNDFIMIDSNFTEIDSGTAASEFGQEGEIDAAYVDPEEDDLFFNSGNRFYQYSFWSMSTGEALDNSELNPFFADGLDAAGTLGDKSYFFKGCKYLIGGEDGEEGELESLGLPCDVDAAWRGQDGKLYVTKEGEYWTLDGDGHVTGPQSLSKLLTLESTKLCGQEEEDIYTVEIEDEKEYEKEHNCVIIDAALSWGGRIYLFNNDEYLAFYHDGQQYRRAPISLWGGLVPNIDASVIWSGNHGTYFFKGAEYYRYTKKRVLGPRSNKLWSPSFVRGVDAAGNYRGRSYFFQGCEILLYPGPMSRVQAVIASDEIGLPCNVDAAFSNKRDLFVIKFNQVWVVHGKNGDVRGPRDLTSMLHVKSWNICSLQ